jgi:4-amino-4-deoxy-L-arabinose transferase-like glycosyltransferase
VPPPHRRFLWWLLLIVVLAGAVRFGYVFGERIDSGFEAKEKVVGGDAFVYHRTAQLLDDEGWVSPQVHDLEDRVEPTADHPPLYILYLAVPTLLGYQEHADFLTAYGFADHRLAAIQLLMSALLGSASVLLVGLLGREVAGERTGLIAALIAAIYPYMWEHDGLLMSETMAIFTTTLTLLAAYKFWKQPTAWRAVALGAATALAALSRAELVLLFALVVAPMLLSPRVGDWRTRLTRLGVAAVAALVLLGPWVGWNLVRFERPVLLSTGFEITLLSANCDDTYSGRFLGYWSFNCVEPVRQSEVASELDQSEEAPIFRRAAFEYIDEHRGRLPVVVLARWGRITGLWPPKQLYEAAQIPEGREAWVARLEVIAWYPVFLGAIAGAVVLRRRREVPVYPLLGPIAVVLFAITIAFATSRYRAPAEPVLCVLAGVAIDGALRALRARRARASADQHVREASEEPSYSGRP